MAEASTQTRLGTKYPLVVYRLIARRYRPVGVLLVAIGAIAQLPRFIPELRFPQAFITYEQLSLIGLATLLIGLGLFIVSLLEGRLAYAQCKPEYFLINTAGGRVAVAYARINETKLDIPRNVLETKNVRGRDRVLMKLLAKRHRDRVLEVVLSDFPLPEKQLRKRLHKFFFSARSERGFVLIVPRPESLKFEIDTSISRAREAQREAEEGERDPLAAFRPARS
jgi:hypothetical protein